MAGHVRRAGHRLAKLSTVKVTTGVTETVVLVGRGVPSGWGHVVIAETCGPRWRQAVIYGVGGSVSTYVVQGATAAGRTSWWWTRWLSSARPRSPGATHALRRRQRGAKVDELLWDSRRGADPGGHRRRGGLGRDRDWQGAAPSSLGLADPGRARSGTDDAARGNDQAPLSGSCNCNTTPCGCCAYDAGQLMLDRTS